MTPKHLALLRHYLKVPFDAHRDLFERRHEDTTADFHAQLIEWFWAPVDRSVLLAFRGSGKSTYSEEFTALVGCFDIYRNILLVGSSETRAAERLAAVSNEFKTNDKLIEAFGDQVSEPWTQTKLVLKNGHCIQAMGRDQDIRGIKHLDWRPDLVLVDDFEDKDNVQTPDGRRKTLRWFLAELLPACNPKRKIRVLGTPMDPESVLMQLIKIGWDNTVIPIEYLDEQGERQPAWPARFPMSWIDAEHRDYTSLGEGDVWDREYMCDATSHASRVFRPEMIKVEPILHTFQARWGMIDVARSLGRYSATTGWAIWSWEKHRLIVWDAGAKQMLPDEVIDTCFRLCRDYSLVDLGIEEDGLNEWLMQPIRIAQLERGTIPVRAVRAPRSKMDFIRGLAAVDFVLSHDMPELRSQLLGFPTGRIDAPNALAYALQLRPGRLIYDSWNATTHIRPLVLREGPVFLVANADRSMVVGILVQLDGSRVGVLNDWCIEGDPGEATETLVRNASVACGRAFTVTLGPKHFDQWQNVGLAQAFRGFGIDVRPGTSPDKGREFIRHELERSPGGSPGITISENATWTLRAFAGGYSRPLRDGYPVAEAADGKYKLLMEAFESFCGLIAYGLDEADTQPNYMYDAQGRRYLSAMPARRALDA
jgi:hypothetical protein